YIAHLPRGIGGLFTVFRGRHVADLPGAIHLVAKTPVRNLVGIGDAVFPPKVTPLRALLYVAILHERCRRLRRAGAKIQAKQRLRSDGLAPQKKLVDAELIGLKRVPGLV